MLGEKSNPEIFSRHNLVTLNNLYDMKIWSPILCAKLLNPD